MLGWLVALNLPPIILYGKRLGTVTVYVPHLLFCLRRPVYDFFVSTDQHGNIAVDVLVSLHCVGEICGAYGE